MNLEKFDSWLAEVNAARKEYWDSRFNYKPYEPLRVDMGRKYIRLWDRSSCWGFVSMVDGSNKGAPVKVGDLLRPASWKTPAKNSRGNIFDGTDKWEYYGPNYLV